MPKFSSNRKKKFLDKVESKISLDSSDNDLAKRCKFNFSYFVNDDLAGQDFKDWTIDELIKLLNKLKEYSKFSLEYWKNQKLGRYPIFVNYGSKFPENSDFKEPRHIPIEVEWCRFHLENRPRVIGFIIPEIFHGTYQKNTNVRFDKNTFYIVFLDKEHKFYKIEPK
jgi:hypothetical protein